MEISTNTYILIGCEESQAICIAFRKLGFFAFSCDLQSCSGGHPEWHIQDDIFNVLEKYPWKLAILHPPCSHLTVSGAWLFKQKQKDGRQQKAIDFFLKCTKINIPHLAIENPIGIMSKLYRKPNQIIQPYMFGVSETKSTCLWLKNLPPLIPAKRVYLKKKTDLWNNQTKSRNVKLKGGLIGSKLRSKTYIGIAEAMAEQWGNAINQNYQGIQFLF